MSIELPECAWCYSSLKLFIFTEKPYCKRNCSDCSNEHKCPSNRFPLILIQLICK